MSSNYDMELVPSSGNVFRDFGRPDAEVLQAKVILAAEFPKTLDARALSVAQTAAVPA